MNTNDCYRYLVNSKLTLIAKEIRFEQILKVERYAQLLACIMSFRDAHPFPDQTLHILSPAANNQPHEENDSFSTKRGCTSPEDRIHDRLHTSRRRIRQSYRSRHNAAIIASTTTPTTTTQSTSPLQSRQQRRHEIPKRHQPPITTPTTMTHSTSPLQRPPQQCHQRLHYNA